MPSFVALFCFVDKSVEHIGLLPKYRYRHFLLSFLLLPSLIAMACHCTHAFSFVNTISLAHCSCFMLVIARALPPTHSILRFAAVFMHSVMMTTSVCV